MSAFGSISIVVSRNTDGYCLRGEGIWEGGDGRAQGAALGRGRDVIQLRQGRGEIAVLPLRGSIRLQSLSAPEKGGRRGK